MHPMSTTHFHPAVAAWFNAHFPAPTPAQAAAWPEIRAGRHTLVAAPTGSGKTLTAFLAAIDALVREGLDHDGALPEATHVVYVSPLKALSNDIHTNLELPLDGIRAELARRGLPDVEIRTTVRTGDTPPGERTRMRKQPPHIVITTPESLYVLLGSASGRAMLATTRTVIVDEIHAIAASKRGAHLALSLERLESVCQRPLQRIGLSATQKPIAQVAKFLVGAGNDAALASLADTAPADADADCAIIDQGYTRQRDLALELPPVPLTAVMAGEVWALVYNRLVALIESHRTTLVFVNTRRMVERVARQLSERLGADAVGAHHGSLSKEHRLAAERRLKAGELRVLVATASLELGIDIGDVELVCQLGSPRSIAAFLQRVGRSGHAVGGTPKGRLFPSTLDDLVECTALLDAVRRDELDALVMPPAPLDVLAQQLVAEVAARDWDEEALFALVRRAHPYRALARADFDALVRMLSDGINTQRGMRGAWLHRDAVHRQVRARRGAGLVALTSGGTIPDTADYAVVLEPQASVVGSVNEDFAIESMAGDIFQLGNQSYRILRVERDRLRVEDAKGQPPNLPFWLGEAPGRSDELSAAVSRLRGDIDARLVDGSESAIDHLKATLALDDSAARQLVEYLAGARAALGHVPTQCHLAMERFFDESGGMQLVIHSPCGSRLNRAWGLALRKRFCRNFNFELQAAATDDAIVLSLSTAHSFPLDEVARYLHSNTVAQVLTQALLDAPLFPTRWRWNATTALALPRFQGGRKVPAPLQRMKSEDLLARVFPDQVACLENIVGERRVPDHPLVRQTLTDCLFDAMDLDGLQWLLRELEAGRVRMHCRDLPAPSPLAAGVLNAAPYAFLDDAPLEERRTRAVQTRGISGIEAGDQLAALDSEAINAVRQDAWPRVRDREEMHEALLTLGFVAAAEAAAEPHWLDWLATLARQQRACQLRLPLSVVTHWVAAERLPLWHALHPGNTISPAIEAPADYAAQTWTREEALNELLRARLGALGPVTVATLATSLMVNTHDIDIALESLRAQGVAMQGHFTPESLAAAPAGAEWCERHLLARIHRATVGRLRREIEPVTRPDFMRFLFEWQRVAPGSQVQGPEALAGILGQLEGFEAAAGAWESHILPARVADYSIGWLDDLGRAGRVVWTRLGGASHEADRPRQTGPLRSTPIALLPRRQLAHWSALADSSKPAALLSSRAHALHDTLQEHGALFFDELMSECHLLRSEVEDALGELVAAGRVNADSFSGLRALLMPAAKKQRLARRRLLKNTLSGIEDAGRWSLLRAPTPTDGATDFIDHIARTLLRRYGVVGWRLLEREPDWLPPWRDLRRVYQRMEARGDIRGGRFIDGLVGEQFALPEAVELLRHVRRRPADGSEVIVSGCDPLNLVGTLLAGDKIPAVTGSRILYRDGVAIAALIASKFTPLVELDAATMQVANGRLGGARSRAVRLQAGRMTP
ncbi:MAG TPA: DEAD/DEAH box helicase [Rhodanobacteraceae bacterium]|nr:DEAD/DEAH box helicase [Rhodanobacteraceae bacterium]